MRISNLICLYLVLNFGSALGWQSNDSLRFSKLPRHVVKFSPFHLINFYPTVQLAYEFQLKNNYSLQADLGYVFDYKYFDNSEFINKRGVKLKTEVRYYMPGLNASRSSYFSAEPYANIINFDRETTQIECFDLDCTIQYSRTYNYKVKYREQGLSLKYGIHRFGKKITLDVNMGLTLRFVDYKKPDIIRGIDEQDEWFAIPNEKKRTVFGPVAGVRVGYRIERKESKKS